MSSEIDAAQDENSDEYSDNSYLDEFEGTSLEKVDEGDEDDDEDADEDDEGFEVWDPSLIQKVADAQAEKVRTSKVLYSMWFFRNKVPVSLMLLQLLNLNII